MVLEDRANADLLVECGQVFEVCLDFAHLLAG
jgi:transglutaminase-like putative cysteine protease